MSTTNAGSWCADADRAAEILDRALALPADLRSSFVAAECAENIELREQIVAMLLAHGQASGFLESRTAADRIADGNARPTNLPHQVGESIDRYRLLEVIGEGGFGIVYLAEQLEPLRRHVALKIIKLGMDTREVIARFEGEREALAMMDHPGIARVFDAGATPAGRPYFVMELVQGVPITNYCDAHRLDPKARLRLFMHVCLAVQHAHQKGVIHRDIKPSNVLVAMHDETPAPKVIDFGVAKATKAEEAGRTLFTRQRQIVGTPAYMSPEQAGSTGLDVDTRSDVYSLGVLLYELLTGTTPFDARKLLSAGFDEMVRIIREVEPPRPSTRLTKLGDSGTHVADLRHTDNRKLRSLLRGELDWIVMRCLEKDRAQRYATSGALADDVQRFLADEPVLARAPSTSYRLRKFVRRHRAAVFTAVFSALTLIAATTISIAFAWREAAARTRERAALTREVQERERADREAEEARRQAQAAQQALALAERRAEETTQVAGFQADLLRSLDAEALGRGMRNSFRDYVQRALEKETVANGSGQRMRTPEEISTRLSEFDELTSPVPVADVARRVMDEQFLAAAAKTVAEQFADQPLVQAQIRDALGAAFRALGLFESAESQYRDALELRRNELGREHPLVADSLNNVATMLYNQGEFASAEGMCRKALAMQRKALGERHPATAATLHNLGTLRLQANDLDSAESYFREALEIAREAYGNEHAEIIKSQNNLAGLFYTRGDFEAARAAYLETLNLQRRLLDADDPEIASTLQNLALVSRARGDVDAAEAQLREAITLLRKRLGNEHHEVGTALSNLAFLLKSKGDLTQAEPLYREALAIRRRTLGDTHPDVANTLNNLAVLLREREDFAAAIPLFREAISIQDARLPRGHPASAISRAGLGRVLALSAMDETLPPDDRDARLTEAEALLLGAEADLARAGAVPPLFRQRAIEGLAELYEYRHKLTPDAGFDVRAAEWRNTLDSFTGRSSPAP